MRSAVVATAIAFGLLVGPAAIAQTPTGDSVGGSAAACLAPSPDPDLPAVCGHGISLAANASSGAAGENPSGTVTFREHFGSPSTDFITQAVVTCLSVTGNVAIIGVTGRTQFLGPEAGLIRVSDGGSGQNADTYQFASITSFGGPPLPGPTNCAAFPGGFTELTPLGTNEQGDLEVIDAAAVPSTKGQCKNGGWRSYGVFKNQGDCVSFVATAGKNQPSGP